MIMGPLGLKLHMIRPQALLWPRAPGPPAGPFSRRGAAYKPPKQCCLICFAWVCSDGHQVTATKLLPPWGPGLWVEGWTWALAWRPLWQGLSLAPLLLEGGLGAKTRPSLELLSGGPDFILTPTSSPPPSPSPVPTPPQATGRWPRLSNRSHRNHGHMQTPHSSTSHLLRISQSTHSPHPEHQVLPHHPRPFTYAAHHTWASSDPGCLAPSTFSSSTQHAPHLLVPT